MHCLKRAEKSACALTEVSLLRTMSSGSPRRSWDPISFPDQILRPEPLTFNLLTVWTSTVKPRLLLGRSGPTTVIKRIVDSTRDQTDKFLLLKTRVASVKNEKTLEGLFRHWTVSQRLNGVQTTVSKILQTLLEPRIFYAKYIYVFKHTKT